MQCQPNIWDGNRIGPGPVSLYLCTTDRESPETDSAVMFGAASDGEIGVGLLREHLAGFLRQHRDQTIVCYNAAELHWLLHDLFEENRDHEAIAVLWELSKDCRLVDLAILDQHARRITEDGVAPDRLSLSRLVERHTGAPFPGTQAVRQAVGRSMPVNYRDFDIDRLSLPIRASVALAITHRRLGDAVQRIQELTQAARDSRQQPAVSVPTILPPPRRVDSDPEPTSLVNPPSAGPRDGFESPREFGPLGVGLDVTGGIALRQAERFGLLINADFLPELARRGEQMYARASKALREDSAIVNELNWENYGQIARDPSGKPEYGRALSWTLERKRKELSDAAGYSPLLPPAASDDWRNFCAAVGVWGHCDRELDSWRNLLGAADVVDFASRCTSETAEANFRVQPSVCSSRPNLMVISDLGVPVFHPREGQQFLAVRFTNLRLRCLAALCREWYGTAVAGLYFVVRTSDNPIRVMAERLYQCQRYGHADEMNDEFGALQRNHPEEYRWWVSVTQSLLDVLPLGLPYEFTQRILEREYGLDSLHRSQWEDLSKLLVRTIAPELRNFLDYDPAQPVAENRSKSGRDARTDLGLEPWLNVYNRDRYDPSLLQTWRKLGGDRAGRDGLGNTGELKTIREGIGGRVTSRWYVAEVRRQAWLMLVDDVLKLAAYALAARGFRLLAVVGEEFLLEIPLDPVGESREEVESICGLAASELLRGAGPSCTAQVCSAWPEPTSANGS